MALNIAVVGYDYKLSCMAIRQIAENDMDSTIKYTGQNEIIMEDGTRYIVFSNLLQTKGFSIDQIILTDDTRWSVLLKQSEILESLTDRLNRSCVPEALQIQWRAYEN